jgi:hypothetical protein
VIVFAGFLSKIQKIMTKPCEFLTELRLNNLYIIELMYICPTKKPKQVIYDGGKENG